MTDVRLHRIGAEGLAASPERPAVQREAFEAGVAQGSAQPVQMHRIGIEVMAATPERPGVQREALEAGVKQGGSSQTIRMHRLGAEGLAYSLPLNALSRQAFEAGVAQAGSTQAIRLHRLRVEVLGAVGLPPPVPLPLADSLEFFIHNWASNLTIESSYTTDINRSPVTLSEERRSLQQRPDRVLTVTWLRESKDEVYALHRLLKAMSNTNVQVPLYPDVVTLTADADALDTTLSANLNYRRFHVGARVALLQVNDSYLPEGAFYPLTIQSLTSSTITFTTAIGVDVTASTWAIVPLIDCEVVLTSEVTMETDTVAQVEMTLREVHGANALPPISIGLPDGWRNRLGLPIFEIGTNWIKGTRTTFRRYGSEQRIGRRLTSVPDGDRYSLVQSWNLSPLERDEFWRVLAMFDSRRGRCLGMWVIDREAFYTVATNTSTSISVEPYGTFADFSAIWTEQNIAAAIVMTDGTIHLATVFSVTNSGGLWRLTLDVGQTIDSGIDVTQIERFAPARISHFDSDAMTEKWHTTLVCATRLNTVEAQNERDIDIDTQSP